VKPAAVMRKAWVSFAQCGNPSTGGVGCPSYTENRSTLSIDETLNVVTNPYGAEPAVFDKVLNRHWGHANLCYQGFAER